MYQRFITITEEDGAEFTNRLLERISQYERDGHTVEIQYSIGITNRNSVVYSALLLIR